MWYIFFGFLIGTFLGSLVKALADRSLNNKSFTGRSHCPHCKHSLHWYDLLPIFSYLSLGGKCRYCHRGIGMEYLLVEIAVGILVAFLFWQSFSNFQFPISSFQFPVFLLDLIFKTFFITVLGILFLTDIKKMLIPDRISMSAIWISLIYLISITIIKVGYLYYYLNQSIVGRLLLPPQSPYFRRHALMIGEPLIGSLLSGVGIAGFFTLLIIITKGKGMGGGDVKLGGLIGLTLGFPYSLVALMLSFLSGALVAILLILGGKKHFGESLPFGPFLVLGSLVALFWGTQIVDWYLKLST